MLRRLRQWFHNPVVWIGVPKKLLGPAIELTGAVLVVMGLWFWSPPLALVVAGTMCIFLAQGLGGRE